MDFKKERMFWLPPKRLRIPCVPTIFLSCPSHVRWFWIVSCIPILIFLLCADFEDLMNRNSDYINQVLGGQGETLDSLTSMIDVLGDKLKGSSSACMDLVEKLSALDSLIDDEKRKWVVQVCAQ